jgi:beta-ureidopropionase
MIKKRSRIIRVSLIQQGPASRDIEHNIQELLTSVDMIGERERPDFIMATELSTTPYFVAGSFDWKYFDWADTIPGPVTQLFGEKARKYETHIILPLFEKSTIEGIYYNSAVVLGPDGNIIKGVLPDGTMVLRYAKNHIPYMTAFQDRLDERVYFKEGPGFPVFDTQKGKIGIGICFDRRFPETFRMIALQGAEIVFFPICYPGLKTPARELNVSGKRTNPDEMFMRELQIHAFENGIWVCGANRVGIEEFKGQKTRFLGMSSIIHPSGQIVAQASSTRPAVITHDIDLEESRRIRHAMPAYKLRRPDIYSLINKRMT